MSVIKFSKSEFEQVLAGIARKCDGEIERINHQGLIKGEHVYALLLARCNKAIFVRSSVKSDGMSADVGEDSIRLWVSYHYQGRWVPLGKETYTQRTQGWADRMGVKVSELIEVALKDGKVRTLPIGKVSEGPSESTDGQESESQAEPVCPECGSKMVLRTARKGKNAGNQFWGCSTFPRCRGTRDVIISEHLDGTHVDADPQGNDINWSVYQTAIFEEIENGTGNLVIEAVAGSGKTTTIVHGLEYTPKDAEVAFVAFNSHIAKELARRAPGHVEVSTLHSLGLSNIRNAFGSVKVEPNKVRDMVRDYAERQSSIDRYENVMLNQSGIVKLISLVKGTMSGDSDEDLMGIAFNYNIELNDAEGVVFEAVRHILVQSRAETKMVDFDDMVDFCATGRVGCKQFDILFGDEVQDWNAAQIEMALRSVKSGGRIIGVGDRWQSIYGFRGADINAIPGLIEATGAKVLPLSITYRCPTSHVELAKTLVPHIEAREGAPEGTVATVSEYDFTQKVEQGDLVLCRCNAPLVKPAFDLIRQGKKAVILGRDIGKNLLQLVYKVQRKYKVHNLGDTLEKLSVYVRVEVSKLLKRDAEIRAENLMDKADTIYALSEGCETVRELESKVRKVFSDEHAGVTFSSVHKTKGGQAKVVWILQPGLMPHPKASRPQDLQQERNIQYVAYTRSMSELYFVK